MITFFAGILIGGILIIVAAVIGLLTILGRVLLSVWFGD